MLWQPAPPERTVPFYLQALRPHTPHPRGPSCRSVINSHNLYLSEYCFTPLSAQSWQYRDRRKPEAGTTCMPHFFRMTSRVLCSVYSAQYHRQHCTLHAFEQFGALYMHNYDDNYPLQAGFEPSISKLQAPFDTNEPSGPARSCTHTQ